ncbi:MAG: VOC family protein [Myxococcota bacterium]
MSPGLERGSDGTVDDKPRKNPTLTYVVLRCKDLERSRRFYAALGLALTQEHHGAGPMHYSADVGGTVLELYPQRAASSADVRVGLRGIRPWPDAESLVAAGGVVERWSGEELVVRDPDGHTVHVVSD